jgi:hypothetical protein
MYRYVLNFTKKGVYNVQSLLNEEACVINNGKVLIKPAAPTNNLILRKKEGG